MSAKGGGGGGGCLVSNLYYFNFFLLPCNKKWIEDRLGGWKIKNTRGMKSSSAMSSGASFVTLTHSFFSLHMAGKQIT